jgi:EAL domain-containing protein (putative c-di-GMP-specific phosphodiesterase class I)
MCDSTVHSYREQSPAGLVNDLRVGLREDEFFLVFQPKICLGTRRLLAVEALVRWRHPFYGLLMPGDFMPSIEASRLIREFSRHVLKRAVAQCAAWRSDGHNLPISVNLSPHNLLESDLPDDVGSILDQYRLPAHRLTLEITETAELHDAKAMTVLRSLRERGIRLALDDFGTGYSSLSYLKQMPLHQVKIDQSFTRDITTDPADAVMVKTIIDLAVNFRLQVIAEGVETQEQLDFLQQHGCMAYQGYLFGEPMPIERFEALAQFQCRAGSD